MVTEIAKLHSAARRYCINQMGKWWAADGLQNQKADQSSSESQTAENKRTFLRYQAMKTILNTVEETVPEDFKTIEELKNFLVCATGAAEDFSTKTDDPIIRSTIAEDTKRQKKPSQL